MPRYSCVISYDGSKFCGWQTQPNGIVTVQESLEKVLTLLNGAPVKVTGAGRTDSGVHARGQVASFMMNRDWEPRRLILALNDNLPSGATVMSVERRPDDFDARYDALWREYAFFVWRGPACYPMMKPYVWWKKKDNWDPDLIRRGCAMLEGRHNFSAFCRFSELPENPWRRMHFVRYIQKGQLSIFRIMVGNLDAVGCGRKSLEWLGSLLEGNALRSDSAMTVPPTGLFFWRVGYSDQNRVK